MNEEPPSPPSVTVPPEEVARITEHLFRQEAGKLVATLTRLFGLQHLTLAEDVVQDALARALRVWPYYGVPQNPAAWLTQVARNLAMDVLRREKSFRDKESAIVALAETRPSGSGDDPQMEDEIRDDRLRLLFACCHPQIPQEAQVTLALKTLCGFSTEEIAKAFLTTEANVAKRITRAKQRIREAGIPFEIPAGTELEPRLRGVLQTLYLLFNEGYKASGGDRLIREDLCQESIRLAVLLVEHPAGDRPVAHALVALLCLNAARLDARVDSEGNMLLLEEQERGRWNGELISRGITHLARSAVGDELTEYHLQAGIAACHCLARDYASTDWGSILNHYDHLVRLEGSPVVALNRAVAVANVHGAEAGIAAVEAIADREKLETYHLHYAVLGELESRLGHWRAAAGHFRRAQDLAGTGSEQAFLGKRVEACEQRQAAGSQEGR